MLRTASGASRDSAPHNSYSLEVELSSCLVTIFVAPALSHHARKLDHHVSAFGAPAARNLHVSEAGHQRAVLHHLPKFFLEPDAFARFPIRHSLAHAHRRRRGIRASIALGSAAAVVIVRARAPHAGCALPPDARNRGHAHAETVVPGAIKYFATCFLQLFVVETF